MSPLNHLSLHRYYTEFDKPAMIDLGSTRDTEGVRKTMTTRSPAWRRKVDYQLQANMRRRRGESGADGGERATAERRHRREGPQDADLRARLEAAAAPGGRERGADADLRARVLCE